ncbi:MAG: hypothetical protein RSD57_00845 [Comamonas sp.]
MLGKIESGLLYLMRVVMVILVLFTLFNFALWSYEAMRKPKTEVVSTVSESRNWSDIKINDDELKKTTYSDFGFADTEQVLNDNKLAADAGVATAFAEVDKQLRTALERNPAARKKLDEDNMEVGLAPAKPLPELVKALHDKELANNDEPALDAQAAIAAAATATAAVEADTEDDYKPQPTDIGEQLLSQTRSVISSYGYNAGRAFALGAPAALQKLLADPQVQKGINKQSTSYVVGNLLMNYNMAFSTKAGELDNHTDSNSWLERLLEPTNLLVFTVLLWSFVFLMMIVVFLRVERHLRAMATEGKTIAQRSQS